MFSRPLAIGLLASVALAGAAEACTVPPTHHYSLDELDRLSRQRAEESASIVFVEIMKEAAFRGSPAKDQGRARVLRVHKGEGRSGGTISTVLGQCDGPLAVGKKGVMLIRKGSSFAQSSFLDPLLVQSMFRQGLIQP